ncbi:uncharacterized ATP synthase C chain-like protein, partial [Hevea brasiliensis]|uniref:uncharacterized ATP synthase C chain-like protein n=1 Tax=Hevea brasiliensis TaxID=3981 RepID=UPI0025D14460
IGAGAAVGIGNVFSSLIHSVARNPSLAKLRLSRTRSFIWFQLYLNFSLYSYSSTNLFYLFERFPFVRNLPFQIKRILTILIVLLLSKISFLLMNELLSAVVPFLPSLGERNGNSIPPTPPHHSDSTLLALGDTSNNENTLSSRGMPGSGSAVRIIQAPSPGTRAEVFEVETSPELETQLQGATPLGQHEEARRREEEVGQASSPLLDNEHDPIQVDELLDEITKVLHKLEPSKLQKAKLERLLEPVKLDLSDAPEELLYTVLDKIKELESAKFSNKKGRRLQAISNLLNLIREWKTRN